MKQLIELLISGEHLSRETAKLALQKMLSGDISSEQISSFLTALQCKGITHYELLGFHDLLSERMLRIDLDQSLGQIDLCGTGGDGKNTINISTLAAFVVAGAGVPVAKHGNYSASSACGSSNVLEELGIDFAKTPEDAKRQIETTGICILHAPHFHPALKILAPTRKALGVQTIFNLLGPLLNPSSPTYQLIGVPSLLLMRLFASFREAKSLSFSLVSSRDRYDEISLTGAFDVNTPAAVFSYNPEMLGLNSINPEELKGADTKYNADIFMKILRGEAGKNLENVVVINAAFALFGKSPHISIEEHLLAAKDSLSSKKALKKFEMLCSIKNK